MLLTHHLQNGISDLRYGARTLLKHPGFACIVVLTLALGIGINTAVFSLVHGILLQPLPYAQPEELVAVGKSNLTKAMLVGFQQRLTQTEVATASVNKIFIYSGNGQAVRLAGNEISSNMFSMLRVTPKLGRMFGRDDQAPGQDHFVILSYSLWQTRFGGDPKILGRTIMLNDVGHEVVGVMPFDFEFPAATSQLWVPAEINLSSSEGMWEFGYNIYGRLRPGATMTAAHAEFDAVYPQIWKTCPFPLGDYFVKQAGFQSLRDFGVSSARTTLLMLLGAVAMILLIACVNVASLLLSRSTSREKEIAVRTALGASRSRITTQLLTESVLLGVVAGAVGCGLAYFSLLALKAVLPADTPRLANATIDLSVLLFSAALSVVSSVLFGLAPALQTSKPDIEQTLRANAQSAGVSRGRRKLSAALVVAEISMAVILASGAGLLIKNLWILSHTHTGFSEEHLLFADVTPTDEFCKQHDGCRAFYRSLLDRAEALPGVKSAAYTAVVPMEWFAEVPLVAQDRPETKTTPHIVWYFHISPGYFRTMEIPLLSGRDFNSSDRNNTGRVAIISKSVAEGLWPNESALGKHVTFADVPAPGGPQWATIIGVVNDVRHSKIKLAGFRAQVKGDIYFPYTQQPLSNMTLVLHASGDMGALSSALPGTIAAVDSAVPISHFRTVHEIIANQESAPRSTMWLFSIFAGLALFLGVIGIYSVISYSVAQRTREIGIRMAMGASKEQVLAMILGQGSRLILGGIVAGIAGTLALTRVISSLLYGVSPSDPLTLGLVALVVTAAAILATSIPSLRATRVNPTVCLKYE
ncbi:MAG TPA: ABC transporter permease [Candidatus Angelobacter sp.]|nr:ABC transporter permease [Candidatus Angelobacter sp.]